MLTDGRMDIPKTVTLLLLLSVRKLLAVKYYMKLISLAGGSPLHSQVQRAGRRQQFRRLRRGAATDFVDREMFEGVCGLLVLRAAWDGARFVASPVGRPPHEAD